jgi:hypothetical protein
VAEPDHSTQQGLFHLIIYPALQPLEKTQFDLQFAVPLSPWWLLLLLPLAGLTAYGLYRRQMKGVAKQNAAGLILLRVVLFCGLVFIAFRPSFILRKILIYPGRVVFLVDNSLSMTAKDNAMPDTEALWLSRELISERNQGDAYHSLADKLSSIESAIRIFQREQAEADRTKDEFWDKAEVAQDRILKTFEDLEAKAQSAPGLPDEARARFVEVLEEFKDLKTNQAHFFSGNQAPDRNALDAYVTKLQLSRHKLYSLQASLDTASLQSGNEHLKSGIETARQASRLDLVNRVLRDASEELGQKLPGQYFLQSTVMSPGLTPLSEDAVKAQAGATDILGRLDQIIQEESDFPLTSVVLFSEGRDLSRLHSIAIQKAYARKQVPIFSAAVGSDHEPYDIAVLKVQAPPFAVKGSPVKVSVYLKAVLQEEAESEIQVFIKGAAAATEKFKLKAGYSTPKVDLSLTPDETGMFRCRVQVNPAMGEVFPIQNNTAEFAINVREKRVKVLFLDWKPRWETRFALNILQRMDFIELNSIIAVVQEKAEVKRGVRRGAWPENLAALEMYDLVILGDLSQSTLPDAEWEDLKTLVWEKGKSLCIIGNGLSSPVPRSLADSLLPVTPQADKMQRPPKLLETKEEIALTSSGRFHPITRLLAEVVESTDRTASDAVKETQTLLLNTRTSQALIATGFAGKGKLMLIQSERLWKLLNPTALEAHAQVYVGLVSWAIEGMLGPPESTRQLGLDKLNLSDTNNLQVWTKGVSEGVIEAISGDEVLLESPIINATESGRATFEGLPAHDLSFRLKGTAITTPTAMVIHNPIELKYLARNQKFLKEIAAGTGGEYRPFTDFEKFLLSTEPKERIEKHERIWRLWDAASVLAFLVIIVTVEWVWRKFVGLV